MAHYASAWSTRAIRKCRTIKPYETQHRLKYERPRVHQASATLRKHSTTTIRCLSCTEREAVKDPKRSVGAAWGGGEASFVAETSMRARDKDNFRWRSVPPEDRMGDSSVKSSKRHELAAVLCHAVMYVSGVVTPPRRCLVE
ncbi:hypothetical protein B0T13DRAFT_444041 [Neurospora crassa]|nr:hypothetical protein B0T13DRAFT_444041 [Neurospora crassa]